MILEVLITEDIKNSAQNRTDQYFSKFGNKGTLLVEKSSSIKTSGYLGEQLIKELYPILQFSDSPEFDFIYNNLKFEIKSVSTNTLPKEDYEVSVMAYQKNRNLDYFIFTRILNNYKKGYVLGFISKSDFFKKAILIKKGTKNNNFIYDNDRYCLKIKELNNIKTLSSLLEGIEHD